MAKKQRRTAPEPVGMTLPMVILIGVGCLIIGGLIGRALAPAPAQIVEQPAQGPASQETASGEVATEEPPTAPMDADSVTAGEVGASPDASPSGEDHAARSEPPAANTAGDKSPETALKDSIKEAVSLLQSGKERLFVFSFGPPQLKYEMDSNPNGDTEIPPHFLIALRMALLSGEFTFAQNDTIAEVTFELVPEKEAPFVPTKPATAPTAVVGLGDDLQSMLQQAAELLEADKLEEFIRNVFPVSKLAELEQGEAMSRYLGRIQLPAMREAMIRDLKGAAASKDVILDGDVATITLPPMERGDPSRIVKFEKIDGNWRFIDADRDQWDRLVEQSSQEVPPMLGSIVFHYDGTRWQMQSQPQIKQ